MSKKTYTCLFCQHENEEHQTRCQNCGMGLTKKHPNSAEARQPFFKKMWWVIVIFCLIMMFYLPR